MTAAIASGCDTQAAWLPPATSVTVDPARFAMARCASGEIKSSFATFLKAYIARWAGRAGILEETPRRRTS